MKIKLLNIIEKNPLLSADELAAMLDVSVEQVHKMLEELRNENVILGTKTIINWDKAGKESVSAFIELKTVPQRDKGFDAVAERVARYDEVKSVFLMSGAYDLAVLVECRTMRDVAVFVAEQLATIEGVTATATHFIMERYKDFGVTFENDTVDLRGNGW
ncbi:MAG: Lrp/AsnC family transcriptional regulator [Clostridia bacterium]|nr:Lrp/AsnC family transcriptional regulator [Clostridia bacterium]MBR6776781.1 Lrp/AsnC family transcriptional regulator [Clostridia bacterium]